MSHNSKPLIGISCSSRMLDGWGFYSATIRADYINHVYIDSLERAGASVVAIPCLKDTESMAKVIANLDGVLFSGGADISPRHYGEPMLQGLQHVDHPLDDFQLELARQVFLTDLPVLGICRGIQVMTVANKGCLYQDLVTQVPDCLLHRSAGDISTLVHKIKIRKQSLLEKIIDQDEIWINSGHHQAVKIIPKGFVASAHAPDGIIEAIEKPDHPFCLGVQWHPEGLYETDKYAKRIFHAFVNACRE